jgi:hypothetical protein
LGSELFDRLTGPPASSFPDAVRSEFQSNGFEAGMRALFKHDSALVLPFQRQIALYLLLLESNAPNHYDDLLRALTGKKVLWSTINYDCLLEVAMERTFKAFNYAADLSRDRDMVKLHGSANFKVDGGNIVGGSFVFDRGQVLVEGPLAPLSRQDAIAQWSNPNEGLAPIMSLFIDGKDDVITCAALDQWRASWAKSIAVARSVVCIGIRIYPADTHIWDVIRDSKAKLAFVGPEVGETHSWAKSNNRDRAFHLATSFDAGAIAKIRRFVSTS